MAVKRAKRRRMSWTKKGRPVRSRVALGSPLQRVRVGEVSATDAANASTGYNPELWQSDADKKRVRELESGGLTTSDAQAVADAENSLGQLAGGEKVARRNPEPQYADEVRFFVDKEAKTIITADHKYLGKGWEEVRVGNYSVKTRRDSGQVISELLEKYYPTHRQNISLFAELSYHSSFHKKGAGKITNYGTNDYNLQFSDFKPLETFKLLNPVKTTNRDEFAKVKNEVTLQEWHYIVLDWRPESGDSIKLSVKEKVDNTLTGEDKTLFQSREFDLSEKAEAIKLFRETVAAYKRGAA